MVLSCHAAYVSLPPIDAGVHQRISSSRRLPLALCVASWLLILLGCSTAPKRTWQTWAFADIMADAYVRRRESERPDLPALTASAAFMCKAFGELCKASFVWYILVCHLFFARRGGVLHVCVHVLCSGDEIDCRLSACSSTAAYFECFCRDCGFLTWRDHSCISL